MRDAFHIFPVGTVHFENGRPLIRIFEEFAPALLNLESFSHLVVLYWFHKNDTPERRATLRVHPRGDRSKPLSGVFATRSPMRPNPLALSVCKMESINGLEISVDQIDAFEGTPVIDIKPYLPRND